MDLSTIPIMSALKKHMKWLNGNQSVISQNIANANTPGYRAKELEKQDFSALVDSTSGGKAPTKGPAKTSGMMRTTHSRHITGAGGSNGGAASKEVKGGEESLNGNSVVLEEEALKLANNQMKYGMVVKLYRKNMGLLRIAMGKGAGRR